MSSEAIFAGLSVLVAAALGIWQVIVYNNKKSEKNKAVKTNVPTTSISYDEAAISKLTPEDIKESLRSAIPYLKEETRKSFEGIIVDWVVKFGSVTVDKRMTKGGLKNLITTYSKESIVLQISFYSSVDRYPQLKILKVDECIRIRGKIKRADSLTIELEHVEILTFE